MNKNGIKVMLVIVTILVFAGCGSSEGKKGQSVNKSDSVKKIGLFPDKINNVEVFFLNKGNENEQANWELDEDDIKQWKQWVESFDIEYKDFKKGETPDDERRGSRYEFYINNGKKRFVYIERSKKGYILSDKKWYAVSNPPEFPLIKGGTVLSALTETSTEYEELVEEPEIVSVKGSGGTMKMRLPEGWDCEILKEGSRKLKNKEYGFRLCPVVESSDYIQILNNTELSSRTGLKSEKGTLAGEKVSLLSYSDMNWSFIEFLGKKKGIVVSRTSSQGFIYAFDDIMQMLDTIELEK